MWSLLVTFGFNLIFKLYYLVVRLLDIFRLFPLRLGRIINHFSNGIRQLPELALLSSVSILFWWIELILYLIDLLGLIEIYEGLNDLLKFNTRPLHQWEVDLAKSVYGDSIRYQRVRIDGASILGPKQFHICYVSGYLINSWGYMNNSLLIHELMHVWQYQHMGLVYIPRALRAYHSIENYNYGGVSNLIAIKADEGSIFDFNLEQQADIIADYYRIRNRFQPNWGSATLRDLPTYEYFVQQVHK